MKGCSALRYQAPFMMLLAGLDGRTYNYFQPPAIGQYVQ